MVYYYLNRIISTAIYLVLMAFNLYVNVYLYYYFNRTPIWERLPFFPFPAYLPELKGIGAPRIVVILVPFGLFIFFLVLIAKLYTFMRANLFKKQVREYEKARQARYEAKIHKKNRQ